FYFRDGPTISGLKSSQPSLETLASGQTQSSLDSSGSFQHPYSDHDLDQIDRLRRIHSTFALLSSHHQALLATYFADHPRSPQSQNYFAMGSGRLDAIGAALTGLSLAQLSHISNQTDKSRANEIREQAKHYLRQA